MRAERGGAMPGGGDEAAAVKNGQSPPRSGAFLTAARTMAPTVSFGMQIAETKKTVAAAITLGVFA